MAMFRRTNRDIANVPQDPASTLGPSDVLHDSSLSNIGNRITAGSTQAVGKAKQFYKENPKLVGGIALVASALLLNKLRAPRS